ncbi:MAG: phosphate signaling complex protein PhoU [Anaerolineae bacterium]|nr:phosphate signaling complex protein PhoU [Anaerolineae bacterium]
MTTRSAFDRQLNELLQDVLTLAEMVESQLTEAIKALEVYDVARAQRVADYDSRINRLRYEIEENAYTLLALQSPMARDMRRIVAMVSVVTNLERMGDHAAGIARLVIRMANSACTISCAKFDQMAELSIAMLRDAMTALDTQDVALAKGVINRDEQVDALHKAVYDELIATMTNDPATVECATMLMWCSHNLERYADRVSNICDRIMYLITGNLHEARIDPMP